MIRIDSNTSAFLALVRAGLWEEACAVSRADWGAVLRLAEEQAVVGLVAAGLEHVPSGRIPKAEALAFGATALQIERRNAAMNGFVGTLVTRLRVAGVAFVLVKGQGVARCYARPLWRACGDVDLLLDAENYLKAKELLAPLAQEMEPEGVDVLHQGLVLDGWLVELHGTLRSGVLPRMDRVIDRVQVAVLGGDVRFWRNGSVGVPLPGADGDIVLIFTHLVKHFIQGGIGLRQVCDWCRVVWTFRDSLDLALLEARLREAGLLAEWRAFAALAVSFLGMPADAMPLYSPDGRWHRKAERILARILQTGNFGRKRDTSYQTRYPRLVRKTISFWRHTKDCTQLCAIFPRDAVAVWWRMLLRGLAAVLKGV